MLNVFFNIFLNDFFFHCTNYEYGSKAFINSSLLKVILF